MDSQATDTQGGAILALFRQFDDATRRRDVEALMAMMTDDCVFENTLPPPDGTRYDGAVAVRAAWEELFRSTREPVFETEEVFACGDRCVIRWVFSWGNSDGTRGHVRGVDVWRVRDGKVAEMLSYVKG
ncbi:MAG: nuclear transport factor 2 family protein [Anaerolineae bacterium]